MPMICTVCHSLHKVVRYTVAMGPGWERYRRDSWGIRRGTVRILVLFSRRCQLVYLDVNTHNVDGKRAEHKLAVWISDYGQSPWYAIEEGTMQNGMIRVLDHRIEALCPYRAHVAYRMKSFDTDCNGPDPDQQRIESWREVMCDMTSELPPVIRDLWGV